MSVSLDGLREYSWEEGFFYPTREKGRFKVSGEEEPKDSEHRHRLNRIDPVTTPSVTTPTTTPVVRTTVLRGTEDGGEVGWGVLKGFGGSRGGLGRLTIRVREGVEGAGPFPRSYPQSPWLGSRNN